MTGPLILDYKVVISGCEITCAKSVQEVRDYHFNKAMASLYKSGCRRIKAAVPVRPRAGDAEIYIMRGFR